MIYYSKEKNDTLDESIEKSSSEEEEHNECVLMDFESKDGSDLEDGEYYEGELITALDELRKARNKNKLLKEEIQKLKENKPPLVDNYLKTQLDELEKFKENLMQQIVI